MLSDKEQELINEIEDLKNWLVEHPKAEYEAKKEVLRQWAKKSSDFQSIQLKKLQLIKNEFKKQQDKDGN